MSMLATATPSDNPLATFGQAHAQIMASLQRAADLPALLESAAAARETAQATLLLFRDVVLQHHQEEETELFPAVLRSATPEEVPRVRELVAALTEEHRAIEDLWRQLRPQLERAAGGQPCADDTAVLGGDLVFRYLRHATFEEENFLPLAHAILSRDGNHLAALGLALHMRHVRVPAGHV